MNSVVPVRKRRRALARVRGVFQAEPPSACVDRGGTKWFLVTRTPPPPMLSGRAASFYFLHRKISFTINLNRRQQKKGGPLMGGSKSRFFRHSLLLFYASCSISCRLLTEPRKRKVSDNDRVCTVTVCGIR